MKFPKKLLKVALSAQLVLGACMFASAPTGNNSGEVMGQQVSSLVRVICLGGPRHWWRVKQTIPFLGGRVVALVPGRSSFTTLSVTEISVYLYIGILPHFSPTLTLNANLVAAQLSLLQAGTGEGWVQYSALDTSIGHYPDFVQGTSVQLSDGTIVFGDTNLRTLIALSQKAIKEGNLNDAAKLNTIWALIENNCGRSQ